ncbi:MAG: ABC transporter substrate-binding protein [Promethearchaeota archaeon]
MEQRMIIGAVVLGAIVVVAVGIVGLMIYSPPEPEPPEEFARIRYGGQYYPGEFLLKGYPDLWEKYHLNVTHTLFASGAENNEALLSRKVDVNCGSDTKTISLFNAAAEGGNIEPLIIGTLQRGDRYSTVIPADSSITSWTELEGERIGYRAGTGADTIMRRYFADDPDGLGLSFDDFDWQSMDVADMAAALQADQIAAFTAWEPTPAIAVDQGIGKLLRSYGDVALVPVSLHTTKSYAAENPDILISFLAAHLDKLDMIKNNRSTAADYAADAASEYGSAVSAVAFEDLFQRIDYTVDFNTTIIDDILATANFLKNELDPPLIDTIPTLNYNRSFIEAAKELQEKVSIAKLTLANPLDLAAKIAIKHGLARSSLRLEASMFYSLLQEIQAAMVNFLVEIKSCCIS